MVIKFGTAVKILSVVSIWIVQHFNLSVELCELYNKYTINPVHRLHKITFILNAIPNALFAMGQ